MYDKFKEFQALFIPLLEENKETAVPSGADIKGNVWKVEKLFILDLKVLSAKLRQTKVQVSRNCCSEQIEKKSDQKDFALTR